MQNDTKDNLVAQKKIRRKLGHGKINDIKFWRKSVSAYFSTSSALTRGSVSFTRAR